jgi:hypothetical protein
MLAEVELPSATSDLTTADWSPITPGWLVGMPMPATWHVALGEIVAPRRNTLFPDVVRMPPHAARGALGVTTKEK